VQNDVIVIVFDLVYVTQAKCTSIIALVSLH